MAASIATPVIGLTSYGRDQAGAYALEETSAGNSWGCHGRTIHAPAGTAPPAVKGDGADHPGAALNPRPTEPPWDGNAT